MLTWISNIYYFVKGLPGTIWRATSGKQFVREWWFSHYS